ncbi:hypothetical protein EMCRGX_G034543 [Ephydatia muelleri]
MLLFFVAVLCFFATTAANGFPACSSSNAVNILTTTTFGFTPGEAPALYACPLNDAANNVAQTAVWILKPNSGHCNFTSPANVSACVDPSGSLVINDTRAVCSAKTPVVISCVGSSSITIDCRKPGFYLSNASNFNATIGSTFSTIPAWISYGLISTSLQLLQFRNGSYVPSDAFAVDYARLDRCLITTAPEYPLQVTIRLAGSEPVIAEKSLLGRHIFVVVGNSSSLTFTSPPVYLDVQNATSITPTAPSVDFRIIGIAVGCSIVGLVLLIVVITIVVILCKKYKGLISGLEKKMDKITDDIQTVKLSSISENSDSVHK